MTIVGEQFDHGTVSRAIAVGDCNLLGVEEAGELAEALLAAADALETVAECT